MKTSRPTTIKQIAALLGPYAENGEGAVSSRLNDYKDSPSFAAVIACIESAEKNPKFAADHYRGALLTLGLRAKIT